MPTGVVTLPLRGRRFAGAQKSANSAGKTAPSPVIDGFIAGQENTLVAGVIGKFLGGVESPDDRQWLARRAPLLLLGPTGCGKTHLARGVAELWHGKFGAEKVAYLTASDFHRQFSDAMRDQRTEAVRAELRSCQLVVIEDLDRLSQADYLQHELVMLLDALAPSGATGGGVLLATATKPLVQAVGFTRPVLSRFAGGLTVELARLQRCPRGTDCADVPSAWLALRTCGGGTVGRGAVGRCGRDFSNRHAAHRRLPWPATGVGGAGSHFARR